MTNELNKLFVCTKCGHSIAEQLDNLDVFLAELESSRQHIEIAIKRLNETKVLMTPKMIDEYHTYRGIGKGKGIKSRGVGMKQ